MASEQELEEIRRRVDIVDLISNYVTMRKAGANFKALCPFHEERTGSFMISPEKQIYKCFGCNEGGDIFGFVIKMEGLNFPEAIRFLADRSGVKIEDKFEPTQEKKDDKNRLLNINELASKYFQTILLNHELGKGALEYLKKRGISEEMIRKFRIGFAPEKRGLGDFLVKRGFRESEIAAAGKPERFYKRIMFPIADPMGTTIAFTGREFPDGPGPKYLNTAETALFHKSRALYGLNNAKMAIRQKGSIIFVEGQMDVIASHQAGVENVVASSGTAVTEDHFRIMYRYAQRFVLAFDNDEAGQKATEKVIEICLRENYTADVCVLPAEFKDAGEVIEKVPQMWPELIKKAIPAVQWHFDRAFSMVGDEMSLNGTQKKQIAAKLLPIINQIADSVEKQHYLQKLANRLSVTVEILKGSIKQDKYASKKPSEPVGEEIKKIEKLDLQGELIGQLINNPGLGKEFIGKINEKHFTNTYITIVKMIKIWYNEAVIISENVQKELISYLRKNLNEADQEILKKIIDSSMNPKNELEAGEDNATIESAINQTLEHLSLNYHENQKLDFARAIGEAEESGDRKKVKELLSQLQTFLQSAGGIKNGEKDN